MSKLVQVYDLHTKSVTTVPLSELAPGMVVAEIDGLGQVFISEAQAHEERPVQHPPFNEVLRGYLRLIKSMLDEVYPRSLEEWENGFREDAHPDKEMAVWMLIGMVYQRCTEGKRLSPPQRTEYFKLIVSCSMNPPNEVLQGLQLQNISREEAEKIVEQYKMLSHKAG